MSCAILSSRCAKPRRWNALLRVAFKSALHALHHIRPHSVKASPTTIRQSTPFQYAAADTAGARVRTSPFKLYVGAASNRGNLFALQALSLTKAYEEEDEADDEAEEEAEQRDRAAAARAQAAALPKPMDQASSSSCRRLAIYEQKDQRHSRACGRQSQPSGSKSYVCCRHWGSWGALGSLAKPLSQVWFPALTVYELQGGGMFFYERVYWGARGFLDRLFSGKPSASSPPGTATDGKAPSATPEVRKEQTQQSPPAAGQQAVDPAGPAGSSANPLIQRAPVTAS